MTEHVTEDVAAAEPGPPWLDELTLTPEGPPWLAMGLTRISESQWLLPDHHCAAELAERHRLLAERHAEVVATLPGTEAAGAEVLALVQSWQTAHPPPPEPPPPARAAGARASWPAGACRPDAHPLEAAARLVQEDLVLMVRHDDGYHLDAAVLCFPSHWRLADKIGGSARAIHGPVPRYDDDLAEKVDRFLDRLRPDVIVARRNWSVHDSPDLFAPDPPVDPRPAVVDEVGERFWLRSERQTLRRLPVTGAVLFTIRVQQATFAAVRARPAVAHALAARIEAQPAALTAMNGLTAHRHVIVPWLTA